MSRKKAASEERICLNCKNIFVVLKCKLRDKTKAYKFCTQVCYYDFIKTKERNCKFCNKYFKSYEKTQMFCSNQCRGKNDIGKSRTGFWYENGYKMLYIGNGKGIKEHVKIMEDHIGRKLLQDEVVHHINHIKNDNRLENLQIMDRREHMSLHRKLDKQKGKEFFGGKRPWQTI